MGITKRIGVNTMVLYKEFDGRQIVGMVSAVLMAPFVDLILPTTGRQVREASYVVEGFGIGQWSMMS